MSGGYSVLTPPQKHAERDLNRSLTVDQLAAVTSFSDEELQSLANLSVEQRATLLGRPQQPPPSVPPQTHILNFTQAGASTPQFTHGNRQWGSVSIEEFAVLRSEFAAFRDEVVAREA